MPRKLDRVKKALVVALVLTALLGLAAPGAHAVNIYGIWWMPDESDDDGWGVGIKEQRPINRVLSIDTRASYVSLSSSDAWLIPIESTLLLKMGTLYGGVGAGYYFVNGDNRLKNEFGWYWLAGITMLPGPTQIFGEVKWQNLTADIDQPSGGSVDFDAFAIHAGVTMQLRR